MRQKSVSLTVRVWYDSKSDYIKIAGKGLTASAVSNRADSERYHPNLYKKLSKMLREAGAPFRNNHASVLFQNFLVTSIGP